MDLANRDSIDKVLSELSRQGRIRRINRGLYDYPRFNIDLGGQLSPDLDQVAQAVARQHGMKIVPAGAWAANRLGLSTQVPAKAVYLTDGTSRTLKIGKQTLTFKHAVPKDLSYTQKTSSLVIQALRYLGKDALNDEVIATLRGRLGAKDRRRLLVDARYGIDWIYEVAKKIAADEGSGANG